MKRQEHEKIIIGFDPGTLVTGFGVIIVRDNRYHAVDYGCIRPPAKKKLSERFLIIHRGVEEILQKYRPDAVALEQQYIPRKHNNPQSAIKLSIARGLVMIAAAAIEVPIFEYMPSASKKATVGNGQASKVQVQKMVQQLLGLKNVPEPEDAADALALAICHAHAACSQRLPKSI